MLRRFQPIAFVLLASLAITGCGADPVRFHSADAYPERLSDWGIIKRRGDRLEFGEDVLPYDVNTPLFSDYAQKLRTIYLPPGTAAEYQAEESFDFPEGTIVSKTFFYPRGSRLAAVSARFDWNGEVNDLDLNQLQVVETRLLVRQANGWDALPYVWRGDDAYLDLTGEVMPMAIALASGTRSFAYVVPSRSECASCHATNHSSGEILPIGLKARHLNRRYAGRGANQLAGWQQRGWLRGLPNAFVPRNADWNDPEADLDHLARSYLDSNCGHCHSPSGSADTSGLMLDMSTRSFRALGLCKPPIAAGSGSGGHQYGIVPGAPDSSILVYRMETDDPANRMPEIGRSLAHAEGVGIIRRWISSLTGTCVAEKV